MSEPRFQVVPGGEWPLGPFRNSLDGAVARRQGEVVWLLVRKREKLSLTQEKLAARSGVSRSAIAELEAGRGFARADTIWRLAETLEADTTPAGFAAAFPRGLPTWLQSGDPEPDPD